MFYKRSLFESITHIQILHIFLLLHTELMTEKKIVKTEKKKSFAKWDQSRELVK